ncbi:MAG: D-alanine--D-alanine ligase [Alphaproteobacteria bacterium]|nr:D-alanine--D-alanine ligase [Alphaproteobacteria bacterium]
MKTVAVLMGGWSSEREVSLTSGKACAKALREKGYDVREIDVKRDLKDLTTQLTPKPDVAFNALHGRGGEDGCIQGVLEILNIPYTHSAPLASALAMDKQKAKEVLKPMGVPCPEGKLVHIDDLRKGAIPFKPPYVVKPNNEGSSVGVYIIKEGDNKPPAGLDNWPYGAYALVEKYIPGKELSVAVIGARGEKARALTVTEIISTHSAFYDYEAKYAAGGSNHILPAPIRQDVFNETMRIAAFAHEKLGCTGVTRSDFRYNDNEPGLDGLYYLETNTQPGMTPTSLVPEQAAHMGMSFGELVAWLVENASVHT